MTGKVYDGYTTVETRPTEIAAAHAAHLGPGDDEPPPPIATEPAAPGQPGVTTAINDELLNKAMRTNKNFAALWSGDISNYGNDASRANLGLCRHLAFWTAKDPAAMDAYFRQSPLMRDKWDKDRPKNLWANDHRQGHCQHNHNLRQAYTQNYTRTCTQNTTRPARHRHTQPQNRRLYKGVCVPGI